MASRRRSEEESEKPADEEDYEEPAVKSDLQAYVRASKTEKPGEACEEAFQSSRQASNKTQKTGAPAHGRVTETAPRSKASAVVRRRRSEDPRRKKGLREAKRQAG